MQISQVFLIVVTVFLLSLGQILFKLASGDLVFKPAQMLASFLSPKLALALFVYFFATVMWLMVLKATPLRVAYPFAALAFFVVPAMSYFFLGEDIGWNTFVGAVVIALGVYISVYK